MSDLISRQKAIDVFNCVDPAGTFMYCDQIIRVLKQLPSAEHEQKTSKWGCPLIEGHIRTPYVMCLNCGTRYDWDSHAQYYNCCPNCGVRIVRGERMSDSIVYRKDVYNALVEKGQASRRYKLGEEWELNGKEIREALENVPSAEPKTGRWYIDERPESDREVICSNCEQPVFKYHKLDFDYRPKYCPNCGAKMKGREKE